MARLMRNMRLPTRAPLCMPYTIQYWQWQYRVSRPNLHPLPVELSADCPERSPKCQDSNLRNVDLAVSPLP